MCVCMCVCMSQLCVCICACMCECVRLRVCVCACMHAYMCMCVSRCRCVFNTDIVIIYNLFDFLKIFLSIKSGQLFLLFLFISLCLFSFVYKFYHFYNVTLPSLFVFCIFQLFWLCMSAVCLQICFHMVSNFNTVKTSVEALRFFFPR